MSLFACAWSCSSSSTARDADAGTAPVATETPFGDSGVPFPKDAGAGDGASDAGSTDGGDAGVRTVTGAYIDTYEKDDLTKTAKPRSAPAGQTVAVLVPGASGYTSLPGAFANDGTMTIANVPRGHYFLALTNAGHTSLQECSADYIPLGDLRAARPDLLFVTQSTPVTFNIANLDPWVKQGSFEIASSQGGFNLRPFFHGMAQPAANATTFSPVVDWNTTGMGQFPAGLPEANKGDVVYVGMGTRTNPGVGPATAILKHMTQYAKLTDLTVADGVAATENVSLIAAPQTGSAAFNVLYTKFGAFAAGINPGAAPSSMFLDVFAHPYGIAFPYLPGNLSIPLIDLSLDVSGGTALPDAGGSDGGVAFADYDYGAFAYGQFVDANWKEFSSVLFSFGVSFTAAGATPTSWNATVSSLRPGAFSTPIAPAVGSPVAPRINGLNAFATQAGVTSTPTLSWTAPALGTATSYTLQIVQVENVANVTTLTQVFDAYVYSAAPFKVPAGVLTAGATYFAVITAFAGPGWDVIDQQAGYGTPLDTADCVTATFTP